MSTQDFPPEDELESRQGGGLYPVGRALRATFDADNHDSLGNELTGLMLELARIDDGQPGKAPAPPGSPAAEAPVPTPPAAPPRTSWWQALFGRRPARS